MKKYLTSPRPEAEAAEFSVVPGKKRFTIVSNCKTDKRRLYVEYEQLHYWPQLYQLEAVEAVILDKIHQFFPESQDKAVMINYTKQYERKCQQIAHFNLLEFD